MEQNTSPADQQKAHDQQAETGNGQSFSPGSLSQHQVKDVQQALDKNGYKARAANKQIQANGKLDQQTLSDLGLDSQQFAIKHICKTGCRISPSLVHSVNFTSHTSFGISHVVAVSCLTF